MTNVKSKRERKFRKQKA